MSLLSLLWKPRKIGSKTCLMRFLMRLFILMKKSVLIEFIADMKMINWMPHYLPMFSAASKQLEKKIRFMNQLHCWSVKNEILGWNKNSKEAKFSAGSNNFIKISKLWRNGLIRNIQMPFVFSRNGGKVESEYFRPGGTTVGNRCTFSGKKNTGCLPGQISMKSGAHIRSTQRMLNVFANSEWWLENIEPYFSSLEF